MERRISKLILLLILCTFFNINNVMAQENEPTKVLDISFDKKTFNVDDDITGKIMFNSYVSKSVIINLESSYGESLEIYVDNRNLVENEDGKYISYFKVDNLYEYSGELLVNYRVNSISYTKYGEKIENLDSEEGFNVAFNRLKIYSLVFDKNKIADYENIKGKLYFDTNLEIENFNFQFYAKNKNLESNSWINYDIPIESQKLQRNNNGLFELEFSFPTDKYFIGTEYTLKAITYVEKTSGYNYHVYNFNIDDSNYRITKDVSISQVDINLKNSLKIVDGKIENAGNTVYVEIEILDESIKSILLLKATENSDYVDEFYLYEDYSDNKNKAWIFLSKMNKEIPKYIKINYENGTNRIVDAFELLDFSKYIVNSEPIDDVITDTEDEKPENKGNVEKIELFDNEINIKNQYLEGKMIIDYKYNIDSIDLKFLNKNDFSKSGIISVDIKDKKLINGKYNIDFIIHHNLGGYPFELDSEYILDDIIIYNDSYRREENHVSFNDKLEFFVNSEGYDKYKPELISLDIDDFGKYVNNSITGTIKIKEESYLDKILIQLKDINNRDIIDKIIYENFTRDQTGNYLIKFSIPVDEEDIGKTFKLAKVEISDKNQNIFKEYLDESIYLKEVKITDFKINKNDLDSPQIINFKLMNKDIIYVKNSCKIDDCFGPQVDELILGNLQIGDLSDIVLARLRFVNEQHENSIFYTDFSKNYVKNSNDLYNLDFSIRVNSADTNYIGKYILKDIYVRDINGNVTNFVPNNTNSIIFTHTFSSIEDADIKGWKRLASENIEDSYKWKYLKENGEYAKSEWVWTTIYDSPMSVFKRGNNWKYFDSNGYNVDQFYKENGSTWLSQTGPFKDYYKGWWTDPANNQKYYFRETSGSRVEGRQYIDSGWRYFRPNSGTQAFGWQYFDNGWKYFDNNNGVQFLSGWLWVKLSSGEYNWKFFDTSNNNIDQFYKENGSVWLSQKGPSKSYYKGWWTDPLNAQKYYFRTTSGSRVEGRQFIDGGWRYFRRNTGTQAFGKQHYNGKWNYLDPVTGIEK